MNLRARTRSVQTLPKWLEALKMDPKSVEAGIRWLTPEESEAKRAELGSWYEKGDERVRHHLPDAAFSAAKEQAARYVPVAEGPAAGTRQGHKTRSWLMLAKQSLEELKVALSPVHPPFLWLGGGQTVASLKEAFAPYFLPFVPSEDKLERTVRGFIGTGSGQNIDLIKLHDRYKASAFLEGVAWGSLYPKDPIPDLMPKGSEGESMASRFRDQAKEGAPTFSFRSLHSKSILRAEAYAQIVSGLNVFVLQLRYHAAKQAPLIRELNRRLGSRFPEDLPVDLAGALIGLPFDPPEPIRAALPSRTDPLQLSFGLICLNCLASDSATAEQDLRPYSTHSETGVREVVAHLALRRGLKPLLTDMAGREQHPEVKKQLAASLERLK